MAAPQPCADTEGAEDRPAAPQLARPTPRFPGGGRRLSGTRGEHSRRMFEVTQEGTMSAYRILTAPSPLRDIEARHPALQGAKSPMQTIGIKSPSSDSDKRPGQDP